MDAGASPLVPAAERVEDCYAWDSQGGFRPVAFEGGRWRRVMRRALD